MRRSFVLLAAILIAGSLTAQETPYSIDPASGPTNGGTLVTIHRDFGEWPYTVIFGEAAAQTTRVDEHTLTAITPAHLPGTVAITIFEYDIFILTPLTFTFVGETPVEQFERLLIPVFTPPLQGAFGSEFRTALRVMNTGNDILDVFGLTKNCVILCIDPEGDPVRLLPLNPLGEEDLITTGKPGRFVYVVPEQASALSANLRVYDTSRAGENFGTAIPIVRQAQFRTRPFGIVGVPTADARFRSMLRLYSTAPTTVEISGRVDPVMLTGGSLYTPAYAQVDITGTTESNLIIAPAPSGPPVWGFVSVTNNVTQHITTISPR
jgi:hypothetical protein